MAQLQYDTNAQTISIVDPTGVIPIATDVYMLNTDRYFLPIKLVIDSVADRYDKLIIGEAKYPLTAYGMLPQPASGDRHVLVNIYVQGSAADDMWMYIDDFILTQNEP